MHAKTGCEFCQNSPGGRGGRFFMGTLHATLRRWTVVIHAGRKL